MSGKGKHTRPTQKRHKCIGKGIFHHTFSLPLPKGLYPQSNESLAIVDIDASKGFVYLWVHLSFAIFAIFDLTRQLKLLEMACDQVQTFPLRLVEMLSGYTYFGWILMNFRTFTLFSSLKVYFRWKNYPSVGTLYTFNRGM